MLTPTFLSESVYSNKLLIPANSERGDGGGGRGGVRGGDDAGRGGGGGGLGSLEMQHRIEWMKIKRKNEEQSTLFISSGLITELDDNKLRPL